MSEKERRSKLDQMVGIEVPLSVVLAERDFSLQQILELRPGLVLDFSRHHEASLELHLNGSRVGQGRAVDVGDRLAFLLEQMEPSGAGGRPCRDR